MQYLTLGRNMCQRDTGRELCECVTTSTSVSSLTAQLATSLVTEQLSRGAGTLLIELIQFPRIHTLRVVHLVQDWMGETGDLSWIISPAKEVMFSPKSVCCQQDYPKTTE